LAQFDKIFVCPLVLRRHEYQHDLFMSTTLPLRRSAEQDS
jgi:hypothetical protein